uniref:Uncharacterized protein n=1 Tax=Anopheles stephensi TaxID=30069 RepID=A0A182YA81_ANOST
MSTAYKHLYSCVTFLIFVFVLNFYKNRVHVNRDRDASLRGPTAKLKRAINSRLPHTTPFEGAEDELFFDLAYLEELNDRSKQYPGRCLDVEVFYVFSPDRNVPRRSLEGPEALHYKRTALGELGRKKDLEQPPTDGAGPNSSIYVFLSVLLVLVLAAGVDIAKHLTGSGRNRPEDAQRRLSLQNYQALIREKQKQFRMMKQHYSQPSMSVQRSIDESAVPPFAGTFARREENTPPTGPMTLLSGKSGPGPLLRRQSVPTLMRGQVVVMPASGGTTTFTAPAPNVVPFGRRTSVDSFWDVLDPVGTSGNGSSPEVRRRVRMLHRH